MTRKKPDPTPKIARIRRELHRDFAPRGQRALAKWPVALRDETLAGVSCQIVTPREGGHGRDILYFFGGGYVSGAPEYELPVTAALAVKCGARVIVPRYALAPEHPCPAACRQGVALVHHLRRTGWDRSLVLAGESAGGGLALAVTHGVLAEGGAGPVALVLLSPWCDLRPEGIAATRGIDDKTLTTPELEHVAQAYAGEGQRAEGIASPILAPVLQGWPRTWITTATQDILYPDAMALTHHLALGGAEAELSCYSGLHHAFELYDEHPQAEQSLAAIARFLDSGKG